MPVTPDAALAALTARRFTVRPTSGGKWAVHLPSGPRAQVPPADDPASAIAAADAWLTSRESAADDRRHRDLIALMQRGTHFARPRTVRQADPDTGGEVDVTVFDIIRTSDRAVIVTAQPSVVHAWRALVQQVGAANA